MPTHRDFLHFSYTAYYYVTIKIKTFVGLPKFPKRFLSCVLTWTLWYHSGSDWRDATRSLASSPLSLLSANMALALVSAAVSRSSCAKGLRSSSNRTSKDRRRRRPLKQQHGHEHANIPTQVLPILHFLPLLQKLYFIQPDLLESQQDSVKRESEQEVGAWRQSSLHSLHTGLSEHTYLLPGEQSRLKLLTWWGRKPHLFVGNQTSVVQQLHWPHNGSYTLGL
jgi:hypothetical protein